MVTSDTSPETSNCRINLTQSASKAIHRKAFLCSLGLLFGFIFQALMQTVLANDAPSSESLSKQCRADLGQALIIPPPGDAENLSDAKAREYFQKYMPGGIFLNRYLYNRKALSHAAAKAQANAFHLKLRIHAREAGLPPLILFADYERIHADAGTSFPGNLMPEAQSSMLLAQSANADLITAKGAQDGSAPKNIGVDAILGPVLDVDTAEGEEPRQSMFYARMYSDDPLTVGAAAGSYAVGLKAAGLLLFPKHFPGYGTVTGSTELVSIERAMSNASVAQIGAQLEPFRELAGIASGFTTSHASYSNLIGNKDPVTVSKMIGKLLHEEDIETPDGKIITGLGRSNLLLVTDDISNMGSVTSYLIANKMTIGDFAARALTAGHALLLLSHSHAHLKDHGKSYFRGQGVKDYLEDMHKDLVEKCIGDESFRARLRSNATQILTMKDEETPRSLPYRGTNAKYEISTEISFPTSDQMSKSILENSRNPQLAEQLADEAMFWYADVRKADFFSSIRTLWVVSGEDSGGAVEKALSTPLVSGRASLEVNRLSCTVSLRREPGRLACLKARIADEFNSGAGSALVFVLGDGAGSVDTLTLMETAAALRQKSSPQGSPKLIGLVQTSPRYVPPKVAATFDVLAGNLSGDSRSIRVALQRLLDTDEIRGVSRFPVRVHWTQDSLPIEFSHRPGQSLSRQVALNASTKIGTWALSCFESKDALQKKLSHATNVFVLVLQISILSVAVLWMALVRGRIMSNIKIHPKAKLPSVVDNDVLKSILGATRFLRSVAIVRKDDVLFWVLLTATATLLPIAYLTFVEAERAAGFLIALTEIAGES